MKRTRGFTLIELAIVLVIVTILIGGLAVPLSAQIQARRIAETNRILDEAREAVIGYALGNSTSTCDCNYDFDNPPLGPHNKITALPSSTCSIGACPVLTPNPSGGTTTISIAAPRPYLPCPDLFDDGNSGTLNDGDGREDRNGDACVSNAGYLPWVTLGTSGQDAWGNRLTYAVTPDFSDKSKGISSTAAGTIQICSNSGNERPDDCGTPGNIGNEPDVAQNVAAVILSHGANGWGARNVNGTTQALPTDHNEGENVKADRVAIDLEFVSQATQTPDDFDDLVKWISSDQLKGRVCPPGGCP